MAGKKRSKTDRPTPDEVMFSIFSLGLFVMLLKLFYKLKYLFVVLFRFHQVKRPKKEEEEVEVKPKPKPKIDPQKSSSKTDRSTPDEVMFSIFSLGLFVMLLKLFYKLKYLFVVLFRFHQVKRPKEEEEEVIPKPKPKIDPHKSSGGPRKILPPGWRVKGAIYRVSFIFIILLTLDDRHRGIISMYRRPASRHY
jgi:hypothetical protein